MGMSEARFETGQHCATWQPDLTPCPESTLGRAPVSPSDLRRRTTQTVWPCHAWQPDPATSHCGETGLGSDFKHEGESGYHHPGNKQKKTAQSRLLKWPQNSEFRTIMKTTRAEVPFFFFLFPWQQTFRMTTNKWQTSLSTEESCFNYAGCLWARGAFRGMEFRDMLHLPGIEELSFPMDSH